MKRKMRVRIVHFKEFYYRSQSLLTHSLFNEQPFHFDNCSFVVIIFFDVLICRVRGVYSERETMFDGFNGVSVLMKNGAFLLKL